jgi:hypothetical protein
MNEIALTRLNLPARGVTMLRYTLVNTTNIELRVTLNTVMCLRGYHVPY